MGPHPGASLAGSPVINDMAEHGGMFYIVGSFDHM